MANIKNMPKQPKTKHTAAGEIPAGWECKAVDTLCNFRSGGTPSKERAEFWDGEIPWVTAKDMKRPVLIDSVKHVSTLGVNNGTRLVSENNVLILVRGMTLLKDVPVCLTGRPLTFNQDIKALEPTAKMTAKFLAYSLTGNKHRLMNMVDCAGHGTGRLATELLGSFPIPLPPLPEQRKIAETLSSWDRAIEQAEKLIAAKKSLKKGLMQQLLTGKLRFPQFGETPWKTCKLGELFSERKETGRADLPLLSITGDRGVILRDDVERKDTSNADKSKYKRIAPGDIGYNTMRMWQGVSAISALEGIVSPAYTICVPKPDVDVEFAKHLFKFSPLVHLFWRNSQGLVADTLNLKFHAFSRIKVTIPGIEEQRRIAQVLATVDRELLELQGKVSSIQQQKKGLMQKLLTGKVKVNVS
jgi:type I restriction enzyme S subunit